MSDYVSKSTAAESHSSAPLARVARTDSPANSLANSLQAKRNQELANMMHSSPQTSQLQAMSAMMNAAPKPNNTGLPDNLKAGIESLSGISMDNVRVHYNSSQPAQLQAHAYAQGTDIHVAPGQEKHLPHEAWHVVQQAQGRVKPTLQMKGDTLVNDDENLESEADVMGAKALSMPQVSEKSGNLQSPGSAFVQLIQCLNIHENDWKLSAQDFWKKYTPDKDTGAELLEHLSAQSGGGGAINTANLSGKYLKLKTWLNGVFNSFSAHAFFGSTFYHGNSEGRYPASDDPKRYIEYGIAGTGQTRVVIDTQTQIVYLSTHYENPKVLLIDGATPQAVLDKATEDAQWQEL